MTEIEAGNYQSRRAAMDNPFGNFFFSGANESDGMVYGDVFPLPLLLSRKRAGKWGHTWREIGWRDGTIKVASS